MDEFFQLKQKLDLRIRQFNDFKDNRRLAAVLDAVARMADSLEKGGKILVFGNGGSSTQASHFAAELVNKFYLVRKPLPAVALSADSANLTSIANDTDFKYVFSRQVEALGKPGDAAVGISTTIAVCGSHTEPLQRQGIDVIIPVLSEDTPIIQEIHLFILHTMAEMLESKFFSANAKKG